ncbi:cytochrome P450 2K1-like [Mixophyes fleayi]|uniref:cytochrome P450 2K1-like n=1 Tax=Mixophyes fleayi TaxID=3061075 RepID=UPI003F4E3E91
MPGSVILVTAEHTMDLGLFVAICFVLILTLLYIFNNWNNKSIAKFPPGPKCWPLIGNLHIMDLKKPHLTYLELAKTYGSVFSVQMGMKKMVVLAGYETVKDALVNHAEEFGGRARVEIFQNMDKEMGIILSHGDNWKVMRRFTITTLRDFGMGKSTIEDKIVEECTHLIEHVASFKGKQFDDTMIINAAVANIIVAILLGHRMNYEDPQFRRLLTIEKENAQLLASPMVSIYNMYPILGFLPGSHKTVLKNVDELIEFVTRTFVKHLKNLDEYDLRSFIDVFLARQKEEANNSQSYFHNGNLITVVRNLFTAGMETTSTTLCWGLLLMAKYPIVQEKVQDEISRVVGSAKLSHSQRGQMPFTNAVIHEIQRFSDILPLNLPHETTRDVAFKGYVIPKGTFIIPLLSSVLRDKTQFEKPDEFYPNHFLDLKGNFVKKDAFMPFSAGHRVCPGETLARMELFIFFTSLLQKFTFRLPPGVSYVDLSPGGGLTNTPKKHMICAVPRF